MRKNRTQVATRGGVFGPGGYGGGVFDGSNMGFGAIGAYQGSTYEQAAAGIGGGGLGAIAPSPVCTYFPYECQNWDKFDASTQAQILERAKEVNRDFQNQVYLYKKEGACDGTQPGRMAGALKEELIAKGGDASKMDPDPEVFGAGECAEWWRVFKRAPTAEDAKKLFGTKTLGPLKVTLNTICSGNVTAPTCKEPTVALPPSPPVCPPGEELIGGACQPVTTQAPPARGGMSTAWIVGGLAAAAIAAGLVVAAKKKKRS